jgi:hypothetical protein
MAKDLLDYAKKDQKEAPKGASKSDLSLAMGLKLFEKFSSYGGPDSTTVDRYESFCKLVKHIMAE